MNRKGFAVLSILMILIGVLAIGTIGYLYFRNQKLGLIKTSTTSSSSTGWQLYQSGSLGAQAQILYPPNWTQDGVVYALTRKSDGLIPLDLGPENPSVVQELSRTEIHFINPSSSEIKEIIDSRGGQATIHYTYSINRQGSHMTSTSERWVEFVHAPGTDAADPNLWIISAESSNPIPSATFNYFASTFKLLSLPTQ